MGCGAKTSITRFLRVSRQVQDPGARATVLFHKHDFTAVTCSEDLLTSVKRLKLKWYGHVTRSSRLAKTTLHGTVQGGRRRGRQRNRWEDNIKEWTGLEWNIILRKAENSKEWRKLVVKSTLVPKRSARLRDRYDKKIRR